MMKKTVSILLTILLVFGTTAFALTAAAEEPAIVNQGYCGAEGDGTNLTWVLTDDGTLTISGEGKMKTFKSNISGEAHSITPWISVRDDLKHIVLEEGVTSISRYAFKWCKNVTDVSIPSSVAEIGLGTFAGCSSLTGAVIPNGVTRIENTLFSDCSAMLHITIPDSVTSVGNAAFYGCSGLTDVELPAAVTKIGYSAFNKCSGIKEMTIPEGVTTIDTYTFSQCTGLETISLPDSLKTIGSSAFADCINLTEIDLPDGLTNIGSLAFIRCSNLKSIEIPDGVITLPSCTFFGCRSLERVDIPNGLLSINNDAFTNCTALTSFAIPKSLRSIHESAFCGASALASFTVAEENDAFSVGSDGCLYNKEKTVLVRFPAGSDTTAYTIPTQIRSISDYAFNAATTLESITIPASMTMLNAKAFNDCRSLSSISVEPDNPEYAAMDNYVVKKGTTTLVLACKTSVIPRDGSVTAIGDNAFANTPESYLVPGFIQSYGKDVFTGCSTLKTVVLEPGFTKTPQYFLPDSVTAIVIPDSVTEITRYCCASYFNGYNSEPNENFVIYYTGSEEQWNQITIENWAESYPNQNIVVANKHFNYQFRPVAATPSTCTEPGYTEGLLCDVADIWVSGHEALPLADHTPAAAVHENETAATCTEAGGYDEVVYCSQCPAEISRNHIDVPAPGHSWGEWEVIRPATVNEEGLMQRRCLHDATHVEEQVIPKLKPNTTVFQQFIEMIKTFFENLTEWIRRLFRW